MQSSIIIKNFLWRFAERCGAQIVSFIVSIVLARLLEPSDYGRLALVMVFVTILQVFVDSGLSTALIQKQDADDLDFSSVFYFNFIVCIVLYGVLFASAPYVSKFYHDGGLTLIIRIVGLVIIVSCFKGIQQAYVSKNMLFKRFFFSTIVGTVCSAILGIYIAYNGGKIWALVIQQLSNATIDTIILWLTVKWRPLRAFSWQRLKQLLSFGWKLLVSALLDTVYNNLRNLIVGKLYTSVDLAYYEQGEKIPKFIVTNINTSIDSVLLPIMSDVQNDKKRVKQMTRKAIKTSIYFMAPIMMGLVFCAEPIVRLVFTDKWLDCVPYVRIFCITYMFWPVHTANLNALNAMGRSDWFLKLEIIKKTMGIIILISTMRLGVMVMAYSLLLSCVLGQIINAYPNKKLIAYGYLEQLQDFAPSILVAVVMGICIYLVGFLPLHMNEVLFIQVVVGVFVYVGFSRLFKLEEFEYLLRIIKTILNEKERTKNG